VNARRLVALALALVSTLALATVVAPVCAGIDPVTPSTAPLTNEEIVRMVASGAAEREILEAIRTRPEAFDLADDMVDELKLAGVSAVIVAAMARRHAESAPAALPPEQPTRGRMTLVVTLNAGAVGPRTIRVPKWADEDAKERLRLPKETEQREVKDLAVFLACTSSEHIPDLWRSKTPLGRDMIFVSRHEMLAFVAGDTPAGKTPQLALPARIEADIDAADPHDLVLGVAARIGDRWLQLAVGALPKVTIIAGQKPLTGRIEHAGRGFEFKVELLAPR
jgi:hypothetical protein